MTRKLIAKILDQMPYISRLRNIAHESGAYSPGHHYSPVPSRAEVLAHIEARKRKTPELSDIRFNHEQQFEVLRAFEEFYRDLPFTDLPNGSSRYYYDQTMFCYPDAIFLYSFLRQTAPARIIEVGSGFSSAVILDTVDRFFPTPPEITFIEPYITRLQTLLRGTDKNRVTVIQDQLQNLPVEQFSSLSSGDLLFIDSSHVMKYGSDLQFLFFEVIPRLPVGVYVHFHDIFGTFEYPERWLQDGWYWNEDYFLRAFLAYNRAWEIYFFNNYVCTHFKDYIAEKMPLCLKDVGGSLYLRKISSE
jgi:hypothetical protein